jgi:hypothetical protein
VLSDRVEEQTISERKERVARPDSARITAEAIPLTDQAGFLLSAERSERCEETLVAEVNSTRRIKRAPDWLSAALWASAGAGGAGLGSWMLVDVSNVRVLPTSGLTVAGGAAVIVGVVTLLRGTDTSEDLGTKPVRRESVEVACRVAPASNIKVELVPVTSGLEGTSIALGSTSSDGKLRISKSQLRSLFETTPEADKAQLRVGPSKLDIDLRATKVAMARGASEAALTLAKADRVDDAEAELNFATKLGGETAPARMALTDAPTTKRRLAEVQEAHERKWGHDIKDWGTRKENQHVYRLLRSLLLNLTKTRGLTRQWTDEKQKNDAAETPDEVVPEENVSDQVISVPLFPEVSGSFSFIKILDEFRGEALFEAADGIFVLRLSPGDSFRAVPGQSVHMTAHNRGETMLMTTGGRLPVFMSGSSPARTRMIPGHHTPERRHPGHHPNRSKERTLKKELETLEAALERRYLEIAEPLSEGEHALKDAPADVRIVIAGSSATRIDKVVIGDSKPVYCVEVDSPCAKDQAITLSLGEFIGK